MDLVCVVHTVKGKLYDVMCSWSYVSCIFKSQVARNNVATSRAMTAGIMMINGLTVVV